jgi:hypothetical protein
MKRTVTIGLLLLAAACGSAYAHADVSVQGLKGPIRLLGGLTTVPADWDGIWTTTDSTYDCSTGFKSTNSGADTICAGESYTHRRRDHDSRDL